MKGEKKGATKTLVACCVRLTEEMNRALERRAKRDRRSKNFLLTLAVESFLQNDTTK
jgi:predicted transcriptional regulator